MELIQCHPKIFIINVFLGLICTDVLQEQEIINVDLLQRKQKIKTRVTILYLRGSAFVDYERDGTVAF